MIRNISIGIDIGSAKTKVVVGEFLKGEKNPKIIGVGESETKGVRHGYVINNSDAVRSIKNAVLNAEKNSNIKIKRAFISISGTTLRSEISSGSAIISKANSEVTNLDVKKALEDSENNLNLNNKKVIHTFPISFKLDGKDVLGSIEGMRGNKLEVRAVFITYSSQHLDELLSVVTEAGVEVIDVIASPIAGSHIALSEKQKIVGSGLVNIGAETTTLSVFENGNLTVQIPTTGSSTATIILWGKDIFTSSSTLGTTNATKANQLFLAIRTIIKWALWGLFGVWAIKNGKAFVRDLTGKS